MTNLSCRIGYNIQESDSSSVFCYSLITAVCVFAWKSDAVYGYVCTHEGEADSPGTSHTSAKAPSQGIIS